MTDRTAPEPVMLLSVEEQARAVVQMEVQHEGRKAFTLERELIDRLLAIAAWANSVYEVARDLPEREGIYGTPDEFVWLEILARVSTPKVSRDA